MKTNVSALKRWMACPLQAHFAETVDRERELNAKASFGVCVHDALELYNRTGNGEAAVARFRETWENPEILDVVPTSWPRGTSFGGLRKRGVEMIRNYVENNKWERREVVAYEHPFCVPIGNHVLSGVVDLVEVKKSGRGRNVLRIVDYKTNSKQPFKTTLALDIQFTAYVYASMQKEFWVGNPNAGSKYVPVADNGEELFERFEPYDRRAIWYHLWTNKELDAGSRDMNDFLRLHRCIVEVNKAKEKEVFVPNISGDSCVFCDFTDLCLTVQPVEDKLHGTTVGSDFF